MTVIGTPISTVANDLRDEFRDISGQPSITNAECDLWLNRGLRLLDEMADFVYSPAKQAILVAANEYFVPIDNGCRAIEEVWIVDSTGVKEKLNLVSKQVFRAEYPDIANTASGKPVNCCRATTRPADTNSEVNDNPGYDTISESRSFTAIITGIILQCPLDDTYVFEVFGKFYSPLVGDDNSANWWVVNHTDTVLAAAMYKLYLIRYRDSEGAKDYMTEIKGTTMLLDYDVAEDDANRVSRMEG